MSEVAKVIFRDDKIVERKIGDYTLKQQAGYLRLNDMVAHEISVRVPDDGKAYAPGTYLIGAETFRTDDYGRLVVSKKGIVLVLEKLAAK